MKYRKTPADRYEPYEIVLLGLGATVIGFMSVFILVGIASVITGVITTLVRLVRLF